MLPRIVRALLAVGALTWGGMLLLGLADRRSDPDANL